MAAGSHIGFDLDNIRPPTKCNCWSSNLVLIGFIITEILRFLHFAVLALPIHAHFWRERYWGIVPHMISPIVLTSKRHFLTRKRVVWATKREN